MWTAAYRAKESERRDAIFNDPYARRLAGQRGFDIAKAINSPMVRGGVVLRTAGVDREMLAAIRETGCDTVLDLAAGLDTRAWRLPLSPELRWIDVDLPGLLDYKESVMGDAAPACRHKNVRLDLADRAGRRELFAHVAAESTSVVVLTEGLLSYLEPEMVGELAADLHAHPEFVAWITELSGNQVLSSVRNAGDGFRPDDAKARFAPIEGTAFFVPYGWEEVSYLDLFMESASLGRDSLLGRILRAAMPLLPAKVRAGLQRSLGVVRLRSL
jgi:methyltransferase (TIGR00027 family)